MKNTINKYKGLRMPGFGYGTLFCLIILASCQKAGLGGNATLVVFPQHHGFPIINHIGYPDTVFLKFNVNELPGTRPSDYDAFFIGTPREDFVKIEGVKAGKYFVYAVGYDSVYGSRVKGGMPLKIKYSERQEIINLILPVVE